MSSLFVTGPTLLHGVFAQSVPPPSSIQAVGTGNSIILGQFPWGPSEALTYPGSFGSFGMMFNPPGFVRTNSAWLSVIRKAWPSLGAVRVTASSGEVSATLAISSVTPHVLLNLVAKYPGAAGNSLVGTVAPASDGNANHFNLTVSITSASGTTQELYPNIDCNTSVTSAFLNITNSTLIASYAQTTFTGAPVVGLTNFSTGADGAVVAANYVGTPGANDQGMSLLEGDPTINFVFTDDSGNSLRATVLAGLSAHIQLLTDRMGCFYGPSGQTATAAQADVASYRSIQGMYVDPWFEIYDDTTGALQNVPGVSWAASVCAQIPASLSPAWAQNAGLLSGMAMLEQNRGAFRAQNTASGIMTGIKTPSGNFKFEAGVNTSLVSGQNLVTRTRMGIFIAESTVNAWQPYVDGPNVPFFQQDLINSLDQFLGQLRANQSINPAILNYIVNYAILPPASANTASSIAGGAYTVPATIQTGSDMSQIMLQMTFGPSNIVSASTNSGRFARAAVFQKIRYSIAPSSSSMSSLK